MKKKVIAVILAVSFVCLLWFALPTYHSEANTNYGYGYGYMVR